jgi:carbamoyl-phosphate synthase large subunit
MGNFNIRFKRKVILGSPIINGNIGVQVRRDRNRTPKIVEINPRIQGTIVHCIAQWRESTIQYLLQKQALGIVPSNAEQNVK